MAKKSRDKLSCSRTGEAQTIGRDPGHCAWIPWALWTAYRCTGYHRTLPSL